ncbi:MAG: insulinase family protein, partial [Clostridia bacterium]
MNREKIQISKGINIIDLTDKKFKTMKISVNFIMPLKQETSSAFSLIVGLLTQSTKEYPSITALSKRLSELYGADLTASATRYGDCQMLNISSSGIADRFALDNENLTEIFAKLITKALFEPCQDELGFFQEENFEQERRQILEAIESEFNDKRTYAINKCRSQMFKGEPAEINRYGSEEDVKNLDRLEMNKHIKSLLDTAIIEILVLGDCNFDTVVKTFKKAFDFERKIEELSTAPTKITRDLVVIEEEQKLSQSKLVLGFKFDCEDIDQNVLKLLSMVLGGSPSSKFFLNVREKLSLCYYCAAGPDTQKNAFFVDSGVETVNIEKAKE